MGLKVPASDVPSSSAPPALAPEFSESREVRSGAESCGVRKAAVDHAQRYGERESQQKRILIVSQKEIYAHPDVIEESNAALKSVSGGTGAFMRLGKDESQRRGALVRVVPVMSERAPDQLHHKNLVDKNKVDAYHSHADCHLTAQTIMGSDSDLGCKDDTERPVVSSPFEDKPVTLWPTPLEKLDRGKMKEHVANRGLDAFLLDSIPKFGKLMDEAIAESETPVERSRILKLYAGMSESIKVAQARIDGKRPIEEQVAECRTIYRNIQKQPLLAAMFAQTFKVNDWAEPQVGDALVQINDEEEKGIEDKLGAQLDNAFLSRAMPEYRRILERVDPPLEMRDKIRAAEAIPNEVDRNEEYNALYSKIKSDAVLSDLFRPLDARYDDYVIEKLGPQRRNRDLWNFHWAGVVMRDGDDYVTLENLSTEKASEINNKWYFQMYRSPLTDFHSVARADSHVGHTPITLVFRAIPLTAEELKARTSATGDPREKEAELERSKRAVAEAKEREAAAAREGEMKAIRDEAAKVRAKGDMEPHALVKRVADNVCLPLAQVYEALGIEPGAAEPVSPMPGGPPPGAAPAPPPAAAAKAPPPPPNGVLKKPAPKGAPPPASGSDDPSKTGGS